MGREAAGWLFVAALCLGAAAAPKPMAQAPELDPSLASLCMFERAKLLALDEHAFDQNLDGGWRTVARHEECHEVAADLIREYRETRGSTSAILFWHEGQLRAFAGATDEAIRLFEKSHRPFDPFGWNLYVDASIAFLKRDRPALLAAREALASLPRPKGFERRDAQGKVIPVTWPPNLRIVEDFLTCFGRPYKEAYNGCS